MRRLTGVVLAGLAFGAGVMYGTYSTVMSLTPEAFSELKDEVDDGFDYEAVEVEIDES
mgnify:CR=1 FL=1